MESSSSEGEEQESCSCLGCNPQFFSSTLLGILACVLVTGGVFLAFHKWDYMWLLVTAIGIVLIIIGAALHCCAPKPKPNQRTRRPSKPRPTVERGLHEQLLPTAPPLGNACSISQLSLNMLPPYFPAYGTVSSQQTSPPLVTHSISQIMQINGQNFILLPVTGESSAGDTQSLVARLSTVIPADQSEATVEETTGSICRPRENSGCQTDSAEDTYPTVSTSAASHHANSSSSVSHELSVPIKKDAELQTSCPSTPQAQVKETTVEIVPQSVSSKACSAAINTSSAQPTVSYEEPRNLCETNSVIENNDTNSSVASVQVSSEHECNLSIPELMHGTVETMEEVFTVENELNHENLDGNFCAITVQETLENSSSNVQYNNNISEDSIDVTCTLSSEEQNMPINDVEYCDQSVLSEEPATPAGNTTSELPNIEECNAGTSANSSSTEQTLLHSVVSNTDENNESLMPNNSMQSPEIEIPEDELLPSDQEDEICGRSSPPPSYDEVAQEIQMSLGAFGLAYGTI